MNYNDVSNYLILEISDDGGAYINPTIWAGENGMYIGSEHANIPVLEEIRTDEETHKDYTVLHPWSPTRNWTDNRSDTSINKTKIVLLSDIHYYNKEDYFKLEMIYNSLKEIKPDYITIAGDLLDNAYISDTNVIYSWLKDISLLATVIISIGNHDLLVKEDFEAGFDKKLFDKIDALDNVYVLNDKSLLIDNINFLGITLPASYYYETHEPKDYLINYINNVFPKIDKDNYNILLCHSPLRICNKEVLNSK